MAEPPTCPECGKPGALIESKVIYGRDYGKLWFCDCIKGGVYVGCHRNTAEALGTMANARLRYFRKRAHAAVDPLWSNKKATMSRTDVYHWLASRMGIPVKQCHIGMFDEDQCKVAENLGRYKRGLLDVKTPRR